MRLENGATYVHNTPRGNARVVERLTAGTGTETGVFVFDVPGTSAYTLSLSGRTFGTLVLKASAAGASKRYNGSGASPLTIRGGLQVEKGAVLGTTLTSDIRLMGGLRLEGTLSIGPSTAGATDRSLVLMGADTATVSGTGSLTLQTHFRNIVADSGVVVALQRDIELSSSGHSLVLRRAATLIMGESVLFGQGRFVNEPKSTLCIGSADGLRQSGGLGNIRTIVCDLDSGGTYVFTRDGPQSTGDGLPQRIRVLKTEKPSGTLTLTRATEVYSELHLSSGQIRSSANAMLTLSGGGLYSPPNGYADGNAGWERSFVEGPMRRVSTDTGRLVFPIGSDSAFAPLSIWRVQPGPLTFTAEYRPRAYSHLEPVSNPLLSQVSKYEHWELRAEGSAPDPASYIALSWRSAQGIRDGWRDSLRIAQYENRGIRMQWETVGDRPTATGPGTRGYLKSDLSTGTYGILTLASASPFAVLDEPLSRLEALSGKEGVRLRWVCASSSSCDGCEMQRSNDGTSFTVIHNRNPADGRGLSMLEHLDRKPIPGRSLYRVSCRTGNGERRFSNVAAAFWRMDGGLRIHPNPTTGILHVDGVGGTGFANLYVLDVNGRMVWSSEKVAVGRTNLDLSRLKPGSYILHWKNGTETWVAPFFRR